MWVLKLRYLGIFILSDKLFKCCYEEVKKKFFRATNGIFSKVGTNKADLCLSLINAYCLPILLYGVEALNAKRLEKQRLNHVMTVVLCKLFGTFNSNFLNICQYYMNCLPLNFLTDLRTLLFLNRIMANQSENSLVKLIFDTVGNDDFTAVANM